MNYGMYVAASGVLVNSHRMDVLSNNLANVNTPGFKPQLADVRAREPERIEDGLGDPELARRMLEQIGGGLFAADHHTAFAPGPVLESGRELDVALTGRGTFFAVQATDPDTGERSVQLTRNGRFERGPGGQIVTVNGGHPVLDAQDAPILIPPGTGRITVDNRGVVGFHNGRQQIGSAQLQVTRPDLDGLEHRGGGRFAMATGDTRTPALDPAVRQGYYEGSGTNAVTTMMDIVSATKAATGNANMIRYHDQMLNQSINTFARIA